MQFLIVCIGLAFICWLIGVVTEKSLFFTLTAFFLIAAILFLAFLVNIIKL